MSNRIVIVGGMGPQASLELHGRIITEASKRGAVINSDYPEIVHLSLPIDDFISDSSKVDQAISYIARAMQKQHLWRPRQNSNSLQYCTLIGASA